MFTSVNSFVILIKIFYGILIFAENQEIRHRQINFPLIEKIIEKEKNLQERFPVHPNSIVA